MSLMNDRVRAAGVWLATASSLMIAGLLLHGPIAPDSAEQMTRIAGHPARWAVAHWITAGGLSLLTVTGLIMLTSGSRLTEGLWGVTAWAVLPVASLWVLTTALVEGTVIRNVAVAGDAEMFEAWWAFAEGKANGVALLVLAVAVIAANEARDPQRATPAWSAWAGMVAGVLAFCGWALGMWFGLRPGSLIWLVAMVLMTAWTFWLGVALARASTG